MEDIYKFIEEIKEAIRVKSEGELTSDDIEHITNARQFMEMLKSVKYLLAK